MGKTKEQMLNDILSPSTLTEEQIRNKEDAKPFMSYMDQANAAIHNPKTGLTDEQMDQVMNSAMGGMGSVGKVFAADVNAAKMLAATKPSNLGKTIVQESKSQMQQRLAQESMKAKKFTPIGE